MSYILNERIPIEKPLHIHEISNLRPHHTSTYEKPYDSTKKLKNRCPHRALCTYVHTSLFAPYSFYVVKYVIGTLLHRMSGIGRI